VRVQKANLLREPR